VITAVPGGERTTVESCTVKNIRIATVRRLLFALQCGGPALHYSVDLRIDRDVYGPVPLKYGKLATNDVRIILQCRIVIHQDIVSQRSKSCESSQYARRQSTRCSKTSAVVFSATCNIGLSGLCSRACYAAGITFVCPSVKLVDCDHIMQQKVEMAYVVGFVGALATCVPKPTRIVVSCDLEFRKTSGVSKA